MPPRQPLKLKPATRSKGLKKPMSLSEALLGSFVENDPCGSWRVRMSGLRQVMAEQLADV